MDWLQVDGHSMRPFLHSGESVGVEWFTEPLQVNTKQCDALQVGDLVIGKNPKDPSWVVHRVVGLRNGYQIKGDAAYAWDDLSSERIWGRVIRIKNFRSQCSWVVYPNGMDRVIARLSRHSIPARTLKARVAVRLIFILGFLRRRTLRRA